MTFFRTQVACLLVLGLLVSFVPAPLGFSLVDQAMAQERVLVAQAEKKKRRSLFDVLFGRNKSAKETKKTTTKKKSTSSSRRSSASVTTIPKIKMIEKSPDAKRLLVVGDSLAIDLAKALDRFYAKDTELAIISKGVGSSGFVRDDYFDWNGAVKKFLAEEQFDIVVVAVGINDRQEIRASDGRHKPLTDGWKKEYETRINGFLRELSAANKPVVWMGLPPMSKSSYSKAMSQISSLHRLAVFANGAEFVDIYERFATPEGNYTSRGPDLNGNVVTMRKGDGIHLSSAGSDKAAFFIDKAVKQFYRGGEISVAVADVLAGTAAYDMLRPPFQGIAQIRKLELAGAVVDLSSNPVSSTELVVAVDARAEPLSLDAIFAAPQGRADAFGVGIVPEVEDESAQN